MSATKSLDIAYLLALVKRSLQVGGWTVVVYPTPAAAAEGVKFLAGMLPPGSNVSGRTALLPNRSKITVVSAADAPFKQPYHVGFLGWDSGTAGVEYLGMAAWRQGSASQHA